MISGPTASQHLAPPLDGQIPFPEAPTPSKSVKPDKENQEKSPDKQQVLGNLAVNAPAYYLNRTEGTRNGAKARTDSFARHKANRMEICYADFYKSKKEFKMVQDEDRRFLLEDLYETDKCYYFASAKIEIHAVPAEG